MAINRFSQGSNAQFNPLSMAEISRYPEMLRQKEDSAVANLGAMSGEIKQFNALENDLNAADEVTSGLDAEINALSSDLTTNGYNQGAFTKLVDLKRRKDQLFSEQGQIGKAQTSFGNFQDYKKTLDSAALTGKITEPHRQALLDKSLADFQGSEQGTFAGINAAINPGITRIVERVSKEVKGNKTKAFDTAGITIQEHPNDPSKVIYVTKGGQRLETEGEAISEAVKFVLSNDDGAKAYLGQLEELGLGNSVAEEITKFATGAEDLLGLDKGTTKVQTREGFKPGSGSRGKSAKGPEFDNRLRPISGITSKDGVNLTSDKLKKGLDGDMSEFTVDEKREFNQRLFMLEGFDKVEAPTIAALGQTRDDKISEVLSNHVKDFSGDAPLMTEIVKSIVAGDGQYHMAVDEERTFGSDTMAIVDQFGNKPKLNNRFANDLFAAYKDYGDSIDKAKEDFVKKGVIVPEIAVQSTDTKAMKTASGLLTNTEYIDMTNIKVTDSEGNTEVMGDNEAAREQLDAMSSFGLEKNSSVRIITSDSMDGVTAEWTYTDDKDRIKKVRIPVTNRQVADQLIQSISGDTYQTATFDIKLKSGNYKPGFKESIPMGEQTLKSISGSSYIPDEYKDAGLKFAPMEEDGIMQVELYFGGAAVSNQDVIESKVALFKLHQEKSKQASDNNDPDLSNTYLNIARTLRNEIKGLQDTMVKKNYSATDAYRFSNGAEASALLAAQINASANDQ